MGYTLFFLFPLKNIDCGYSLEPPRRGGSNEYPQSMFWAEIWKISEFCIWKLSGFLVVKLSIYLNRHVFVMQRSQFGEVVCSIPAPFHKEHKTFNKIIRIVIWQECVITWPLLASGRRALPDCASESKISQYVMTETWRKHSCNVTFK